MQFWRNTVDADVVRFLKLFTELPMDEIKKLEQLDGAEINKAKVRVLEYTRQNAPTWCNLHFARQLRTTCIITRVSFPSGVFCYLLLQNDIMKQRLAALAGRNVWCTAARAISVNMYKFQPQSWCPCSKRCTRTPHMDWFFLYLLAVKLLRHADCSSG